MRWIAACLFVLTGAVSATAADVTSFELENGMEVVVLEDHRAPLVVHMVWYKAGAADEPSGLSGIAHYLEHLLFKGTDDMAPGEFSDYVARVGGTDNAFTARDYTGYFQRVAAEHLEAMMRMEADRMRDLILVQEDILAERDVIIEERNQRVENDPSALFREQLNAAQYLNHPYGVPIIGWKHEAHNLTMEDAMAFYRRFYAPNNAVLVVAGDTTPDEVLALAEEYYGVLEPTPGLGERQRPSEPPQLSERRLTMEDPRVAQPYVTRSYLAPERESGAQETAAALELLAEILGAMARRRFLRASSSSKPRRRSIPAPSTAARRLTTRPLGWPSFPRQGCPWKRPRRPWTRRLPSSSPKVSIPTSWLGSRCSCAPA